MMQRVLQRTFTSFQGFRTAQIPARTYASDYLSSKLEESPDKYTAAEKSFAEWKHVEKLIPPVVVPEPPIWDKPAPSGWRSQNVDAIKNYPYFIRRSKNHMLPVYFSQTNRGQKQGTKIRHVEGNIWRLEEDVGNFLKKKYPHKGIVTYVHEVARWVHVHGDYEADVKEWLLNKGF